MSEQLWKPIPGYDGLYEINSNGFSVRKVNKQIDYRTPAYRVIKPCTTGSHGYVSVAITKNGKTENVLLHRLIARMFIPNTASLKTVNHKDGNKGNNAIANLEWASYADNNRHARETGLNNAHGEGNHMAKLKTNDISEIIRLSKSGLSDRKVAKMYSVSHSTIENIRNGKNWKRADQII